MRLVLMALLAVTAPRTSTARPQATPPDSQAQAPAQQPGGGTAPNPVGAGGYVVGVPAAGGAAQPSDTSTLSGAGPSVSTGPTVGSGPEVSAGPQVGPPDLSEAADAGIR